MIIKNYCLQSDIVKVSYQFQLISLCCFVVVCLGIGMTRPFVVFSEDWSVFTINDSLNLKIGEKNEF